MREPDLHILPRIEDASSFLYVEHAIVERDDQAIKVLRADGVVTVPAASLATLVLGPGTTITHGAIAVLSGCGTSVIWAGEDGQRFYAAGMGRTRLAANAMRQARAWADPERHLEVVIRLYRFRFREPLPGGLTLQQIRGREGVRVREAYAQASRDSGVPWGGRSYDRSAWARSDPVNRALSAGAACLYGVCHSAIVAAGYSPALGFIHTGKQLSFVYDVADLYKVECLMPAAFRAVAGSSHPEREVRSLLRQALVEAHVLERLVRDMNALFASNDRDPPPSHDSESVDQVGSLWDPNGEIDGGVNHAGDDA
jgi:CRISPR-associated protein Cas1